MKYKNLYEKLASMKWTQQFIELDGDEFRFNCNQYSFAKFAGEYELYIGTQRVFKDPPHVDYIDSFGNHMKTQLKGVKLENEFLEDIDEV